MDAGLLLSLLVVLILVVLGVVVAFMARRWAKGEEEFGDAFTLQDLREMRERGDISEVEFRTMRGEMLGRFAENNPANHDPESSQSRDLG